MASSARRGSQSADMDRSDDGEPGSSSSSSSGSPASPNGGNVRIDDIRTARTAVEQLQVKLNAATMSDDPNAAANVAKELTNANRRLRQMEAAFNEQERRREEAAKLKEGIQIGIMNTKMTTEDRRREMMELGGVIYRQVAAAGLAGDAMTATRKKVKRLQLMVEQDVLATDRVGVGAGELTDEESATFRAMRKDCVQALQGLEKWLDTFDRHMASVDEVANFLTTPYSGHRSDPSLAAAMSAAAAAAAAAATNNVSFNGSNGPNAPTGGAAASPAPQARPTPTPTPTPSSGSGSGSGRTGTPPLHQTPTPTRPPHSSYHTPAHGHSSNGRHGTPHVASGNGYNR